MHNPPEFPIPDVRTHDGFGVSEGSPGMTLRDWFAGQVIPAIVAATATGNHQPNHGSYGSRTEDRSLEELMALDAYKLADAMLAARQTAAAAEPEMQHVGYYDEDGFDWMTGIKPRACELYAARTQEPSSC